MPIYFGNKIREARKAAGLTQRQLADKINVSNTSISNWEKDLSRPDPDTIQYLCWALNVQPNYFFSVDKHMVITVFNVIHQKHLMAENNNILLTFINFFFYPLNLLCVKITF